MREINNTCPVCNQETLDLYLVTDECWAEAGFTYYQNVHLHCLVWKLHRPISLEDFPDVPVNCDIEEVLEQDVVGLPQGKGIQMIRRVEIEFACERRRNA